MNRNIAIFIIFFFIVAICVAGYFFYPVKSPQPILNNMPTSIPHQHATPDGELIEHIHTYDLALDNPKLYERNISEKSEAKKHPIQLDWERIDIDTVKRKYQPYSVDEMQKMWSLKYNTEVPLFQREKLDKAYPSNKWIKRNLSLGQPLVNYSDYRTVLQRRIYVKNRRDLWRVVSPEDREAMRKSLQLPSEIDTWKEYEEVYLKFWIVASYESLIAQETKPVFVYVEEAIRFSKFEGVRLKRKEKYDLMMFGIVPKGIHVAYLNADEERLPPGVIPRFYERYLRELELAYSNVQRIVSEHKAFYKSNSSNKTKSSKSKPEYNIERSFELLQDLHWGEFPDDLQTLQDAISKLEEIKIDGEVKMKNPD